MGNPLARGPPTLACPMPPVMALVGHESSAMSHRYTHVGKEALSRAAATLPENLNHLCRTCTRPPRAGYAGGSTPAPHVGVIGESTRLVFRKIGLVLCGHALTLSSPKGQGYPLQTGPPCHSPWPSSTR
jgi:hypothetical protein